MIAGRIGNLLKYINLSQRKYSIGTGAFNTFLLNADGEWQDLRGGMIRYKNVLERLLPHILVYKNVFEKQSQTEPNSKDHHNQWSTLPTENKHESKTLAVQ